MKGIKKILLVSLSLLLFACKNDAVKVDESVADKELVSAGTDESWYKGYRVITFGKFEQDANEKNGKESISWIILEDTGKDRLLISKDVLYAMPYDDDITLVGEDFNKYWEKSSIRKWLNEVFYNESFSEEEKEFVLNSDVRNDSVFGINNSQESVYAGADTVDKVYILSDDELREYFGFEQDRRSENYQARPSNFAKKILDEEKGKEQLAVWHKEQDYEAEYDEYAEYWVRSYVGFSSMSANEYYTEVVDKRGHASSRGFTYYVSKIDKNDGTTKSRFYSRGVRPVIRIAGTFKNDENVKSVTEELPVKYNIKRINEAHTIASYDKSKTYESLDTVTLGSYEQDNIASNGKEEIEWFVLKKEDGKALLLSKYILDYIEYSNVLGDVVVWENCMLRAWANHEFYDASFGEKEKVLILSSKIKNYDNPVYGSSSGPETIDKVFVPSIDELLETFSIDYDDCIKESYFDQKIIDDNRLLTVYTDYALNKYRKEKSNMEATTLPDFWLRNQGRCGEEINGRSNNAMTARQTIDLLGKPYDIFKFSSNSDKTVSTNPKLGFRPCIWVDLSVINEYE